MRSRTYEEKLREVELTSLEERRNRGDMITTFRVVNGIDNVERRTWFKMAVDQEREGAANTRNSNDVTRIEEGVSRYELRRNFFSQRVSNRWNSLPKSTRQQSSVLAFKAALDGTILRQPGLP